MFVSATETEAGLTSRDAYSSYGSSFRRVDLPPAQDGSFFTVGDALPDGRLIGATGAGVYIETGVGTGAFDLVSTLDLAPLGGAPDPAFLRVSPDGSRLALGGGFGKPIAVIETSDLGIPGTPTLLDAANTDYFSVGHFDARWMDSANLAITAGDFGNPAFVTLLDVTSDTFAPVNPVIIENVNGSSGGIAFDSDGRLYTGNGFGAGGAGSDTGWIKVFDPSDWSVGSPADFEADGVFLGDVLSASSLSIDADGNLFVGGGDFIEGETGYLGVVSALAIQDALDGFGPLDINDVSELRRLDPVGGGISFYGSSFNPVTGELYVTDGSTWWATVPSPAPAAALVISVSHAIWRRRRTPREMTSRRRPSHGVAVLCAGAAASQAVASGEFATSVIDFTPAPGIFINDSAYRDPARALGAPVGGTESTPVNSKVVSLGGFGGSITLGFDKTVLDHPANPFGMDAIVFGNSFYANGVPTRRWAEAGHIEISLDVNENGLADDPWYLIQGSSLPAPASGVWRDQDWDDDDGTSTPPEFIEDYPDPMFYPGIGSTYTTGAFELPSEFAVTVLEHPQGPGATEETHWGYADVSPTLAKPGGKTNAQFYTNPDDPMTVGITPGSAGGDAFDIAWAIDPDTGAPAGLSGFDFIRITCAVQFDTGAFGEISTEISGVADVAPVIPFGDLNGDGVVDTADLGILIAAFGTADEIADLNGDGIVDTADLGLLLGSFTGGS